MSHLEKLCEDLKIEIKCSPQYSVSSDWPVGSRRGRVTLRLGKRKLTTFFNQGPASTKDPTVADVLYCLLLDASSGEESFEEFCANLGYDTDSRKAHRMWRECAVVAPRVREFLGEHFESLQNVEH